jgi:hypothetical protein
MRFCRRIDEGYIAVGVGALAFGGHCYYDWRTVLRVVGAYNNVDVAAAVFRFLWIEIATPRAYQSRRASTWWKCGRGTEP